MVLRLIPRSPRRRIRLVTVVAGLGLVEPGWADFASDNLTPATGARTTRLCRPLLTPFVSTPPSLTSQKPALRFRCAPGAAASTASRTHVRDDRDTPL